MAMSKRPRLRRCGISGLVILDTELQAKIVLAKRIREDKGEKRYFRCQNHFHLTKQEQRTPQD